MMDGDVVGICCVNFISVIIYLIGLFRCVDPSIIDHHVIYILFLPMITIFIYLFISFHIVTTPVNIIIIITHSQSPLTLSLPHNHFKFPAGKSQHARNTHLPSHHTLNSRGETGKHRHHFPATTR